MLKINQAYVVEEYTYPTGEIAYMVMYDFDYINQKNVVYVGRRKRCKKIAEELNSSIGRSED